jgi:GNAT superfamily N-acetyltransferase
VENRVDLREVGYNHPDVVALVAEVQQEYVRRYGGEDTTPLAPSMFVPPEGRYVLVYLDGEPVAMGGWRRHEAARDGPVPGSRPAEIKRMYVTPRARGRGLARALLADLECSAGEAGCDLMVLETGRVQPEALALYRSAGYVDIAPFGHYTESDLSVHLGKRLRRPEGRRRRSPGH